MNEKNIKAFLFGKARFTVITENLIRMEWSEKELFEDGETLFAVNRNHNGCSVQTEETENEIRIQTEVFTLTYLKNEEKGFYGIQFHTEVNNTVNGTKIIENFLFNVCKCKGDWNMSSFVKEQIEHLKNRIGD